jgi:hypothetical protein
VIYIYSIIEKFKDVKCVKPTKKSSNNIFKPILRYLDNNITINDDCTTPIFIIRSFDEKPENGLPYVYYDGEHSQRNIKDYNNALNDTNCIGCFVTNLVNTNDKTYYLPLFLDVLEEFIKDGCPVYRNYINNDRNKLAIYIARHSPPHRDTFFRTLYSMDSTVEALGDANNTRKVDLPESHLSLPVLYKDYKFVLAMENTDDFGYITEKIANAYISGAIPIYWGTKYVKEIFNIESFVYVNDYSSFEECAKDIIAISNNSVRYETMRNAPIFNPNSSYEFWRYHNYTTSPNYVINIANQLKERLTNLKRV